MRSLQSKNNSSLDTHYNKSIPGSFKDLGTYEAMTSAHRIGLDSGLA